MVSAVYNTSWKTIRSYTLTVGLFLLSSAFSTATGQSVVITSPSDGASVDPGTTITIEVSGTGASLGWNSVSLITPTTVETVTFSITNLNTFFSETFSYPIPIEFAGSPITLNASAIARLEVGPFADSIVLDVSAIDENPPTYPDSEGVKSTDRDDRNKSLIIAWNQAQDAETATENIIYQIFLRYPSC